MILPNLVVTFVAGNLQSGNPQTFPFIWVSVSFDPSKAELKVCEDIFFEFMTTEIYDDP
jgi:hypothetical protein